MITAETVNRILSFHGNGLPVVSLYGRIDPRASPREVHARMMSLLDQVRPLAKDHGLQHRSRLSVRAMLSEYFFFFFFFTAPASW